MTQQTFDFNNVPAYAFPADFFTPVKAENEDQEVKTPETLEVGDFLYNSWGYSMTIVDFYKVLSISKSGKSCTLQAVEGKTVKGEAGYDGYMIPSSTPCTGYNETILKNKRINTEHKPSVKICKTKGHAFKFTGTPVYFNLMD